jgi:Protein of unknown function (DUF992)
MLRSVLAAASAATVLVGVATYAYSQNLAQSGANVGSLTCNVAGGIGFVFGSSKDLSCLFTRTNGTAEKYTGSIKKFGIDVGFTKEAQIVWLVFAPGNIAPGAIAGSYAGATASGTVGVGAGANVLIGGSNKQITLQPVSVEGSVGLNAAAGIGVVELQFVK